MAETAAGTSAPATPGDAVAAGGPTSAATGSGAASASAAGERAAVGGSAPAPAAGGLAPASAAGGLAPASAAGGLAPAPAAGGLAPASTAGGLGVGRPTKRRPGSAVGGLPVADSRPAYDATGDDGGAVLGVRCTACRYPAAQDAIPWCPVCYAPVEPARFAVTGAAWSSTVVGIPVGERRPPFGLAYLDLDDGPRVLVHLAEPTVVPIGTRLRITGTDHGDLVAAT